MNDDIDAVGLHIELPTGLDDFQALIHHRRRVDGDFLSHLPVGMLQGLRNADFIQSAQAVCAETDHRMQSE